MTEPESDSSTERTCNCGSEAEWIWHDGMFGGGRYCSDCMREKLPTDERMASYRDPVTTAESVTEVNGTAVIPAGARPLDGTFPVVRSKEALDDVTAA